MRFTTFIISLLALALYGADIARAQARAAASSSAAPGGTGPGLNLDDALLGILSFTHWPAPSNPLRLCVLGSGPEAGRLLARGLGRSSDLPVTVRAVTPDSAIPQACEALYVASLDADAWRRVLPQLQNQPVLTLCERSSPCVTGSMFRLSTDEAGHIQFELNLDAVGRSTVRINPLVLKLLDRRSRGG